MQTGVRVITSLESLSPGFAGLEKGQKKSTALIQNDNEIRVLDSVPAIPLGRPRRVEK